MRRKTTSVLIVNSAGKENKVLQIPTKFLLNWKKYFIAFNSLVIILIAVLGVMIYQKTSDHYKEKLARANKIRSLIDIKKVKQSFKSIDQSIYKINKFLDERGLEKFKLDNAGGENEDFEITDINEISNYYENKVKNIENTLEITPLGAPSQGEITSGFGYRNNPFGGYSSESHPGIDFKGEYGDPVKATANGTVEFAGARGGYGNCIIISHNDQLKTLFGHLSKINVVVGQPIKIGEIIGEVGSTGRSTGPHLHYEVIQNEEKIDPTLYLKL